MPEIKTPNLVEELAQKLFNEMGYDGNLYRQKPEIARLCEDKAQEILKGDN